jgi:HD-like signal output (HDOD) protein
MSAQHQGNIAGPSNKDAFAFVQSLALEMSAGKIEIPSFPDVAVRIRKVLADDNCDAGQVAKVVSAEPAMAARLLQVANSVALNPNGMRITELKTAIARIGFANVRTVSLAYAMDQIKNGLMHGMGRVYILTRAVKHPTLFSDAESYQQIVRDWNTSIAKAVLESWEISPDIIQAVEYYEDIEREGSGAPDLTDVLTIANLLVSFHTDLAALELRLQETTASKRLGLTPDACQKVLQETAGELTSLRQALGA